MTLSPRSPARRALSVACVLTLLLVASACGQQSEAEPSATKDNTAISVRPETTSAPPTSTTLAPATAAPSTLAPATVAPAQHDATQVALQYLSEVEREQVARTCDGAPLVTQVDHPDTDLRVAVIGDSLTVQIIDRLTADLRFDWSITAACGTRAGHFLGTELLGGVVNLRPGLDAILADQPDLILVALGTNDVLDEVYTNVPRELGASIEGLLRAADLYPCRSWVNVHTTPGDGAVGGPEFRWTHYAPHFNETINAFVNAGWTRVADWDTVVRWGSSERLLLSDGVHLSEEGKIARTDLLLQTATDVANTCVVNAPPSAS